MKPAKPVSHRNGSKSNALSTGVRIGRPTIFNDDIANDICVWMSEGKSLNRYCQQPGSVSRTVIYQWLTADKAFASKYARASEERADTHADEISDIADERPDGSMDTPTFNARQRLRVDARKWVASKLKPSRYGDKMAIGGASDLPPIRSITTDMTPEQAYHLMLGGAVLPEGKDKGSSK